MSTCCRRRRGGACRCAASGSTSPAGSMSRRISTWTGIARMVNQLARSMPCKGFTMIEVLVSLFIVTLGLLGLAALQAKAQQAELESYQRAQALVLVQDMVDRINANRKTAGCYAFTPLPDNGS